MAVPYLHGVGQNRQNPAAIRIGGQRQNTARLAASVSHNGVKPEKEGIC
jgi:hypothetical protein